MNIDTVLISEHSTSDAAGRFTVVNVFNRLAGTGPKWGLPIFYLTIVANGPKREAGSTYEGEIRLINGRRELVTGGPLPLAFRFPPDDGSLHEGMPVRSVVIAGFQGVVFTEPGPYAFEIYVDGDFAAATMIYVEKTDQPNG